MLAPRYQKGLVKLKKAKKNIYNFGLSATENKMLSAGAAVTNTEIISFKEIYETVKNIMGE